MMIIVVTTVPPPAVAGGLGRHSLQPTLAERFQRARRLRLF
jgi:hypothetical protein